MNDLSIFLYFLILIIFLGYTGYILHEDNLEIKELILNSTKPIQQQQYEMLLR